MISNAQGQGQKFYEKRSFELHTVHDLKLSHFFFPKNLQKSVTIWEHLPKRNYFWNIIK